MKDPLITLLHRIYSAINIVNKLNFIFNLLIIINFQN
jgi:hypothetical protein